jgi:predicted Zn-dependent protease
MRTRAGFDALADHLQTRVGGDEFFLASYGGEESDFIRFTQGKVRQAGSVRDHALYFELIRGQRHAGTQLSLSGEPGRDRALIDAGLERLRALLPQLPEDPHLSYAEEVQSSSRVERHPLPAGKEALAAILEAGGRHDLVGIYAAGAVHRGFANSLGQRNWFSSDTFSFEWTLYHHADKAIKDSYAGFTWDPAQMRRELEWSSRRLELLSRPPREVKPGSYRAFLEPAAVAELLELASWGGFGVAGIRTKTSPLLRFWEGRARLHPEFSLTEASGRGTSPCFGGRGFIRPAAVPLVRGGEAGEPLVSPRSAREYGLETNGANGGEWPESLEMAPGKRPSKELLQEIERGLYIQRLWYLNWSDLASSRVTGMTRFASFWVENGEMVAPLPAMRFDETLYHIFGDKLIGISRERERLLDAGTYDVRSTQSSLLPGILIDDLRLTL